MKKWIVAPLAFLLGVNVAMAQLSICDRSLMQDKRVPPENRQRLQQACSRVNALTHCQQLAVDKKLLGDAKTRFVQKCAGVTLAPARK